MWMQRACLHTPPYTCAMSNIPASDNGTFLWMTYQAMSKAGLDCAAIFASVGMPDEPPDRSQRRINSPQQRFWDAAEMVSGDPDIGLRIGGMLPAWRGQVLEYLFLSSPTFGEGLHRALSPRARRSVGRCAPFVGSSARGEYPAQGGLGRS